MIRLCLHPIGFLSLYHLVQPIDVPAHVFRVFKDCQRTHDKTREVD